MTAPSDEELLQENRELREELAELLWENRRLREENCALRAVIAQLEREVTHIREELTKLQEENKQLKAQLKEGPPPMVKPPQKGEPKKPGRKEGHLGTARSIPSKVDEEQELTLDHCPNCGSPLSEPQEERVRYVEDLLPPRLHVTKYRIKRYWCSHCKRLVEKKPSDVLPGHQLGIRTMSAVVYLREELRLPVNLVQRYLEKAGLMVSSGEIEWICTEVAEHLRPLYESYLQELHEGEVANMDETGMRIEGENHWLWAGVRKDKETVVFHHDEQRSSAVAKELLGEEFDGVVGCDFFSAYNPFPGRKQRCWAHLLRETKKLGSKSESEEGRYLHECLKDLWERASSWVERYQERAPPALREWLAWRWERELLRLSRRDWQDPDCQRIARRLAKHWEELFTFVRYPGVEGTNNDAERALRPYVVKRKISGGHRSWKGARKHEILMSVLESCRRRGEDLRELIERVLREAAASAS